MKNIFLVFFALFIFSASLLAEVSAEDNSASIGLKKQNRVSLFLINGKMPHLTKLLIQQWDNPKLQLDDAQKEKLLVIRKETMSAVKAICQQVPELENMVAIEIFSGKTPDELQPLITRIAKLKSNATMLHLSCIYKTSNLLKKDQLELLRSFYGK